MITLIILLHIQYPVWIPLFHCFPHGNACHIITEEAVNMLIVLTVKQHCRKVGNTVHDYTVVIIGFNMEILFQGFERHIVKERKEEQAFIASTTLDFRKKCNANISDRHHLVAYYFVCIFII